MSSIVPWDGVYRIQNVGYPDQKIGLELFVGGAGWVVAGRHEDSDNPRIEWQVQATQVGQGLISKIIIKSDSQDMPDYYIGADSDRVIRSSEPYEWDVPYREVGRWV
ncbi:hypothetical protein BDR04DRAFT_1086403 [Suillus decipiens]|nr:hypothetical protein BDR04DRAFT_1086403 [Suillus decipiens]